MNIWILITLFLTIYTWIDRKSKLHVLYCCNYFTKYKNSVLYILKYLELILFSVQWREFLCYYSEWSSLFHMCVPHSYSSIWGNTWVAAVSASLAFHYTYKQFQKWHKIQIVWKNRYAKFLIIIILRSLAFANVL